MIVLTVAYPIVHPARILLIFFVIIITFTFSTIGNGIFTIIHSLPLETLTNIIILFSLLLSTLSIKHKLQNNHSEGNSSISCLVYDIGRGQVKQWRMALDVIRLIDNGSDDSVSEWNGEEQSVIEMSLRTSSDK